MKISSTLASSNGGATGTPESEQITRKPQYSLPVAWLKAAVLLLMLATMYSLLQYPLRRINSDSEVNFNEGWNAYRQGFAEQDIPLYGARPDLLTGSTNYPPVSFHLVGLLSFHGDVVKTARWISVYSLILTGIFIALTVRELGGNFIVAVFSMLLYVLGITVFLPDRVGMDDPQLLGEAFTTAGLYFYIRARTSRLLLCISALAFCVAGFTKQNLLAFPAAVAIDLLIRSRKRFAIWCGAMLVFGGLLLGLTFAIDGRYFFDHLLVHRAYSFSTGLGNITHFYLGTFQGVMLVALVWTLCRFRSQPLLAWAFLFSNGLAFVLVGGDGVDLNIYFNGFAAAVMVCGVALAEIDRLSTVDAANGRPTELRLSNDQESADASKLRERFVLPAGFAERLSLGLMITLFLCAAIRVPDRLREGHLRAQYMADDDAGFRAAVDLLKATPGPALCESLLLCYRADKPYTFDTYTAIEEIKSHHTDVDAGLPLLRSRRFAIIQLDALPGEAVTEPPTIFRARSRFTPAFVDTLLENYRVALRTSHILLFVPK